MDWKKLVCSVFFAGSLLLGGGLADLWASDAELIDILLKKNVITQEEADRMMQKAGSASEGEKAAIKKEIKEDIKKDAAKGEFLPSALKGFKFGTTIFSSWESISKFSGNDANTNRFVLDRAYVTLTKDVNKWLGMNVTADLFTSKDAQDVGNGLELRIKYAYADLKFFGTSTKVGMVPTPSDAYDSSIWPYRVQGKHLLDTLSIQSSADVGIVNQGAFGGEMDADYFEYGSKSFGGKWGGYMIGLYNGAGYDNPENNNNKAVSGLIYVRPLPMVPILKGLQLAYIGNYGLSNTKFTNAKYGPLTDYPLWQVNIAQASLVHPYFGLMAQYYWGKGAKSSTDEQDHRGYLAEGYVRTPGLEKLRFFGKYYTYDPDTSLTATRSAPKSEYSVYVAGISYDWSKELMPYISWERENNKQFSARTDYDKYQIGFQFKF